MTQNRVGIYASQISGHLWAPEGAYDALATVTLSANTTSITFTGIPGGYKHLQIRGIANSSSGSEDNQVLRFNGDSGNNYSQHLLYGNGSSAFSSGNPSSSIPYPSLPGTSGNFTASVIDILDYASTTKNKTVRILGGWETNSTGRMSLTSGAWYNLSPITSIAFTCGANLTQYSSFALYGVK